MMSTKNALIVSLAMLATASLSAQDGDQQRTRSYRFTVAAVGAHDLGSWSKVTGLDVSFDVAEYRSGGFASASRPFFPGITKFGTVTLSRASSSDADLVLVWLQDVAATGDSPTLTITLFDQAGDPVARWQLDAVTPRKYTVGGFNAEGKEVAIETLVLDHAGLQIICERRNC